MANFPVKYGTSAVGRLIMGDPFNKQTKDQNGRDIPLDKQNYFFGIAVEKNAPGVHEHLQTLQQAAAEGYAAHPTVMQQIQMGLGATAFSWKVQDGDELIINAQTGQQELRNKYGAGCWIFKFSTTLPIRAAKYPPQSNVPVDCDPSEIKRGYFVQVSYSTTANGNTDHTAGVYQNPKTICLVGFGEEIVGGPSLEQQFGAGHGGYTPPGMTQTPQVPMGAPGSMPAAAPVAPGMPAAAPVAPGMPAAAPVAPGMPDPMQSGMPTPTDNGQSGMTSSPGNSPRYGGYMSQ